MGSTTRLQFPSPDEDIESFGRSLRRFVDAAKPESSLLFVKPTGRVPHGGGERILKGSTDEEALLHWVKALAVLPESVGVVAKRTAAGEKPLVRRLTHSQYNHTIRDLLGDETRPADAFPSEDFIHGFTNQAEGQSVSPLQAEAYGKAAERLATTAVRQSRKLPQCSDGPCFVRSFGKRAFRRPLSDSEAARYAALFEKGGKSLVIETMLRSPHFLFRLEKDAWAMASRLSYFLWDTMPDEELFRAAERGELITKSGIEKQVRRMLADDRARASLDEFLGQWLRFDRLNGALRDRNRFPEYSAELVSAMKEETRRLFQHLVWSDGDFREFFSATYTFLAPEMARLYSMNPPAEAWAKTALPEGRAGVVGQATFLTLTSKPEDTSPTERGLFIREHFLCQQVPPPPAGVNTTLPPVTDEKPLTTRQRLDIHLSNQVCAGCHSLVDPIGFGLERFDAIGRYRDAELLVLAPSADDIKTRRKTKPTEHKLPIEAAGFIRGVNNSDFKSPRELGAILANEPACQTCVVKQLFRYAHGRTETSADRPAIDAAYARFRASQFKFRELIIAIATGNL